MSRAHNEPLAGRRTAARPEPAEGTLGDQIPDTACRFCWHDRLVWRAGVWMLEHRGPLSDCTHACHDDETLLPSVS
jgi:hypothetical protein